MNEGIRSYGPGKFSTVLDAYVYSVSLDGGADEDCTINDSWYGLMRNGRTLFRDHDPLLETLNEAEQEHLTSSVGVLIHEDSQGFVYITYFRDEGRMEGVWNDILAEAETAEEEDAE